MRQIKFGSADKSATVRIVDSTDGTPEVGVVAATAGLAFNYRREGGLLVNIAGLSDLALLTTAHADGGLLHIGHGYYRLDVPDLAFAAGADGVLIEGTATGMVVIGQYVQLVGYDPRTELDGGGSYSCGSGRRNQATRWRLWMMLSRAISTTRLQRFRRPRRMCRRWSYSLEDGMPFKSTGKETMLDALGAVAVKAALYTDDAATTEVAGGSYARKDITWAGASGNSMAASNQPVFDVPASTTVKGRGGSLTSGGVQHAFHNVTDEAFAGAGTYTLTSATLTISDPA